MLEIFFPICQRKLVSGQLLMLAKDRNKLIFLQFTSLIISFLKILSTSLALDLLSLSSRILAALSWFPSLDSALISTHKMQTFFKVLFSVSLCGSCPSPP